MADKPIRVDWPTIGGVSERPTPERLTSFVESTKKTVVAHGGHKRDAIKEQISIIEHELARWTYNYQARLKEIVTVAADQKATVTANNRTRASQLEAYAKALMIRSAQAAAKISKLTFARNILLKAKNESSAEVRADLVASANTVRVAPIVIDADIPNETVSTTVPSLKQMLADPTLVDNIVKSKGEIVTNYLSDSALSGYLGPFVGNGDLAEFGDAMAMVGDLFSMVGSIVGKALEYVGLKTQLKTEKERTKQAQLMLEAAKETTIQTQNTLATAKINLEAVGKTPGWVLPVVIGGIIITGIAVSGVYLTKTAA